MFLYYLFIKLFILRIKVIYKSYLKHSYFFYVYSLRTMWTIVCFDADNSVEVVPEFWFHNGSCAWPKKNSNSKKFIEKRLKPNEIEFDYYNARSLSKNIGKIKLIINYYYLIYYHNNFLYYVYILILATLHEARVKVIKAQETSELSSNDDDKNTRKSRKKIWFSSPSEVNSPKRSKLSSPPILLENIESKLKNALYFIIIN